MKSIHQELEIPRGELPELAELVREHFPELIHLVPTKDFSGERPPDSEIIRWTENLRQLEREVRKSLVHAQEIPLGDMPTNTAQASYNAKMIDKIQTSPESRDWSASQWVEFLGCKSKSTVHAQPIWKELMKQRVANRLVRQMKSHTPGGRRVNRKPKLAD